MFYKFTWGHVSLLSVSSPLPALPHPPPCDGHHYPHRLVYISWDTSTELSLCQHDLTNTHDPRVPDSSQFSCEWNSADHLYLHRYILYVHVHVHDGQRRHDMSVYFLWLTLCSAVQCTCINFHSCMCLYNGVYSLLQLRLLARSCSTPLHMWAYMCNGQSDTNYFNLWHWCILRLLILREAELIIHMYLSGAVANGASLICCCMRAYFLKNCFRMWLVYMYIYYTLTLCYLCLYMYIKDEICL